MRGVAVQRALVGEKLFQEDVDACVRKVILSTIHTPRYLRPPFSQILEMVKIAYDSGIPFDKPEELLDTPEVRTLLRRACADATVLLKNEKNLLPLKPSGKIAIIGPNAKHAVISGGGSASLRPTYTVSPLAAVLGSSSTIVTSPRMPHIHDKTRSRVDTEGPCRHRWWVLSTTVAGFHHSSSVRMAVRVPHQESTVIACEYYTAMAKGVDRLQACMRAARGFANEPAMPMKVSASWIYTGVNQLEAS